MNYSEFAQKPRSEKVILVTAEASQKVKLFTLHAGAIYKRVTEHFVTGVKDGTTVLVKATNTSLSAGQFYFDIKTSTLYVRMSDGSNPKTRKLSLTYKFFWANAPLVLPYDLAGGEAVEWEGRVGSIGSLGQQLDDENAGIVLESSSNVSLINQDAYFDNIFDTLIWENRDIEFYSWSPVIPLSEAKRLFAGVIESKSFNDSMVVFNVKDYVYRLRNQLNLSVFTTADGSVSDSELNTPKRRIYGQVKQAQCVGIDKILSGYDLTGTVSVTIATTALTGVATSFLSELSPGDQLVIVLDDGTETKISIDSIESDTAATLGDDSEFNITAKTAKVKSELPYRQRNRRWHLAGHKLRGPSATVLFPTTSRRFLVDSTIDFFADDKLLINSVPNSLKRISGNNFVLDTATFPIPGIGDEIIKEPVSKVFFKGQEMTSIRDWTLSNTTEAIIEFNDLAEFNVAKVRSISNNLVFTNGLRTVTTSATIDLRTMLKPRDWIKKNNISAPEWYEVLSVKEQTITLRTIFTGTTETTSAKIKNIDHIDDDALITADCIGMDYESKWIRTPAQAVRHLVLNDAAFPEVNEESFEQANSDCEYTLSMVIPESIGEAAPSVRDVITKINESAFGSLYGNGSMQISYSVLNTRKPVDQTPLKDDDIISWDAKTEQKIVNKVKINYRPFTDLYNGQSAFDSVEYSSSFVDNLVGIKNTQEKTVYLFSHDNSTTMAQRLAFHKSLSSCKVSLRGKLSLSSFAVNDKVYIELARLFKRYGGKDAQKISIITGIKKSGSDGSDVEIEMTDLGNIFNRVPVIAENNIQSYSLAARAESVKFGFVLDNDTLTPDVDSETDLGNNRIG